MRKVVAREYAPQATEVRSARRWTAEVVRRWDLQAEDATWVVGELASNAVLHGRSRFRVVLTYDGRTLLVEVADANPRLPAPALVPPLAGALSGRGLLVVDRLAGRWGARPVPDGKIVWAELPAVALRPGTGGPPPGVAEAATGGSARA